jgi:hypothetical protein
MWWRVWMTMSAGFGRVVDHALPQTSAVEANPSKPNSKDRDQSDNSDAEEDGFKGPRTYGTKDGSGCHLQDHSGAHQGNAEYDTHGGVPFSKRRLSIPTPNNYPLSSDFKHCSISFKEESR